MPLKSVLICSKELANKAIGYIHGRKATVTKREREREREIKTEKARERERERGGLNGFSIRHKARSTTEDFLLHAYEWHSAGHAVLRC